MNNRLTLHAALALVGCALAGCPSQPSADASLDATNDQSVASDAAMEATVELDALDVTDGPSIVSDAVDSTAPDAQASDAGRCGDPSRRPLVRVSGDITTNTAWRCTNRYQLEGFVFVTGSSGDARTTLTIEPGTIIQGLPGMRDSGGAITQLPGALIISRTARIDAQGTASEPIVFTSAKPVGMRFPADWGGVALLGRGPNNTPTGERPLEGVAASDVRGQYGAAPGAQQPDWDCGTMRYVRIEFAGFEAAPMRELNGLTLGSCGSRTVIDYVQIHQSSDDGVEFFGGTVDVRHVVITGAQDDLLDWDFGWTGRAQFVVGQQYERSYSGASENPDKGIEADNNGSAPGSTPVSEPRISNMTLLGTGSVNSNRGVHLRAGTFGQITHSIVAGFGAGVVDVQTTESAVAARMGRLYVRNSIFTAVGSTLFPSGSNDGADCFENCTGDAGAPNNLIELDHFMAMTENNRALDARLPRPFDPMMPSWVPPTDSPAASGGDVPFGATDAGAAETFFDRTATYVGAFRPGAPDWTAGWCRFDRN
ncbi:MAG: hypothetical protein JNK05_21135 [Myxococcales bacterium]|nr:hypothetical protein [Myxococcales bacterium]